MKTANTNFRVWFTILTSVAVIGLALFLNANTHTGHCYNAPEGQICKVLWGHK